MNATDRKAFRAMAPALRLVHIVHMQKRPAGGAWHVAVCALGSSTKAPFVAFVTRSRTTTLPAKPEDWNTARTEPLTEPTASLVEVRGFARGWAAGRWGRWSI